MMVDWVRFFEKYGFENIYVLVITLVCGISGWTYQLFLPYRTEVAFRIRPELINLNFWEAIFSSHLMEWMNFFYPRETWIINVVGMPLFGLLIGVWIIRSSE